MTLTLHLPEWLLWASIPLGVVLLVFAVIGILFVVQLWNWSPLG